MDYSHHDSLLNNESFSNKLNLNLSKKQIYSEERKVFNTEVNERENNFNNFEVNPADFITNKGKINVNMNNYMENKIDKNKSLIKLEDGISINIIKSHGDQRVKKFFHIPDFEIYVIKVNNNIEKE